jgi:histidine triad (HIT) family protein
MVNDDCLFCRIAKHAILSDVIWEDDDVIVFRDIHPKAKVHVLVIPKQHINSLAEVGESDKEILGKLLVAVQKTAQDLGINNDGFRTIINTRTHGGQEVDHLHFHILGGEPIGPYANSYIVTSH